MAKETYTFKEVRGLLGIGERAFRTAVEKGEINIIGGKKVNRSELERLLGHPITDGAEGSTRGASEAVLNAEEAAKISEANRKQAEDDALAAEATSRKNAAALSMTPEDYNKAQVAVVTLKQNLELAIATQEARERQIEDERKVWNNTIRQKDIEIGQLAEDQTKSFVEVAQLREALKIQTEEETKLADDTALFTERLPNGIAFLKRIAKSMAKRDQVSWRLGKYLWDRTKELQYEDLTYEEGMGIFDRCSKSIMIASQYYQEGDKSGNGDRMQDWLSGMDDKLHRIMALPDEQDKDKDEYLKKQIAEWDIRIQEATAKGNKDNLRQLENQKSEFQRDLEAIGTMSEKEEKYRQEVPMTIPEPSDGLGKLFRSLERILFKVDY